MSTSLQYKQQKRREKLIRKQNKNKLHVLGLTNVAKVSGEKFTH